MLADTPIGRDEDDRLGFGAYADAIAELIDNPGTFTPLTLAISAPWGAGKTSLAQLVERRLIDWPLLRGDRPHIVAWFNAWLHDDAPHLGAACAADIAKAANRHRTLWRRFISPLPGAMLSPEERWRRRIFIAVLALIAAIPVAAVPGMRHLFVDAGAKQGGLSYGASLGSVAAALGISYALWSRVFAIAQAASSFVDDPRSEAAKGSMADVRRQLGRIIAQGTRDRRLVIFVDDLERCRPPRAVEVCETVSQLLGHPNVVTVLIADMRAVAAAAAIKYAALEGRYAPQDADTGALAMLHQTYGRAYLEKIVQIQIDLPTVGRESLAELLTK
jgi:hypothetical protein